MDAQRRVVQLLAEALLELAAHLLHVVRGGPVVAAAGPAAGDHAQRRRARRLRLRGGQAPLLLHEREDEVPPLPRAVGMAPRVVVRGPLQQRGEERALGHGQLRGGGAEVVPRRGLDALGPVPEVDVVQVQLEDLVLPELALDLRGHPHLEQLARQRPLAGGDALREDVPRQLHGDGAEALVVAARAHVGPGRAPHPRPVHAAVAVEALVLHGEERPRAPPSAPPSGRTTWPSTGARVAYSRPPRSRSWGAPPGWYAVSRWTFGQPEAPQRSHRIPGTNERARRIPAAARAAARARGGCAAHQAASGARRASAAERAERGRERPTHHQHPTTPRQTHTWDMFDGERPALPVTTRDNQKRKKDGPEDAADGWRQRAGPARPAAQGRGRHPEAQAARRPRHRGAAGRGRGEHHRRPGRRAGDRVVPRGPDLRPRRGGRAPEPPRPRPRGPHARPPLQGAGGRAHHGGGHRDPAPHAAPARGGRRPRRHRPSRCRRAGATCSWAAARGTATTSRWPTT